jgi:glutamate dehydrogenase
VTAEANAMQEPVDQAAALVDELAVHTSNRVGSNGAPETEFVRHYWSRTAADDLVDREPSDLVGAALVHLHLARHRSAGEPLVRVYTPTIEDDGWHSSHSVVDCVIEDMPFIVDSLTTQLDAANIGIHLLVHPIVPVERDEQGDIRSFDATAPRESFVHIEIDRLPDGDAAEALQRTLRHTLDEVRQVVDDWSAMRDRALAVAAELDAVAGRGDEAAGDLAEAADLLRWLTEDHFTFLSYREYELVGDAPADEITSIPGTGLGLQRDAQPSRHRLRDLLPDAATVVRSDALLQITKTNAYSPVHRHEPMD